MIPYLIAGVIGYGIAKLFEEDESPKYDDGGSVLLAPNGKPSKLTPEQYKLVRLPEFKAWFGDWENDPANASKVIDEETKEPLVVYHGTNSEFNIFDTNSNKKGSDFGSGAYFGNKKTISEMYGERIIGTFLNLRKPLILKDRSLINVIFDEFIDYKNTISNKYFTLKDYIIKNGSDGIVIYNPIMGEETDDTWFVCYEPNQIKLADGSNTTFDGNNPDIRYKTGGEIKDLVVLHNINDYQIEEANKIGGLITPSIGIVKSGNSFNDFGSITLIGTKELIDPENRSVKVFAGDVYSPSVPRRLWYVDNRTLEKVTNELKEKSLYYDENISNSNREFLHLVNRYIGNSSEFDTDIQKNSFNQLIEQYFEKLKLIYIIDKSIKIKVPFKDKRHFLWNHNEFTLTPEQKKRFAPILREYTKESNEKGSNGISDEIKSKVYDLFLEVLNDIKLQIKEEYKGSKDVDKMYNFLSNELSESFEEYIGTRYDWRNHTEYILSQAVWSEKLLDEEKLNQNIKKVFTKDVIEDYKKWLSDFIYQFQGRAYFLKGNEKMSYNLENLVDATSNRVVGQEKNITFSVNQAKSFGTKRLNSINEIKKNSNKLISKQEMNLIDEKNSDNFSMLSQSLKYEDENTWRKLDSLGKALADYFKGTSIVSALRKNDFKTPSSYQITLFEDFADELKNSPVDYFEAKYQRAVSLKEFKYAVVPKKTSKEVIQILIDNEITIKKYENEEQRLQIINTISNKDKSIKFEYGGRTL